MRTHRTLMALVVLIASPAFAQSQRQDNPSVKETLRWMQTTLESGAGDYSVGHEVRSVRLEDFVGCKVHFSYSTHQEPYANGEPSPEPNKTYHVDYLFGLGDIDPTNITFSKGSGLHAGDDGLHESPSFLTIRTRNDEKKITIRLPWESEADSKPDDASLIFSLDSIDNDYVVRFAKAFKHAVEACGGKPSLFADSDSYGERTHAANSPSVSGTYDGIACDGSTKTVALLNWLTIRHDQWAVFAVPFGASYRPIVLGGVNMVAVGSGVLYWINTRTFELDFTGLDKATLVEMALVAEDRVLHGNVTVVKDGKVVIQSGYIWFVPANAKDRSTRLAEAKALYCK